jgi:hypothetical protein
LFGKILINFVSLIRIIILLLKLNCSNMNNSLTSNYHDEIIKIIINNSNIITATIIASPSPLIVA